MHGHLLFHSPCFDGIASAVVLADFLATRGWEAIEFAPVNYHLRGTWLATPLPQPGAVVDFLYHPEAAYWADHHGTTFLTDTARADFQAKQPTPQLVYDTRAPSCAGLLWRHLQAAFKFRNPEREELVQWAEAIDAARYHSVEEVFAPRAPALRINASLTIPDDADAYCVRLVKALQTQALAEVAELSEVRGRIDEALAGEWQALEAFFAGAQLTPDGIVVFDFEDPTGLGNRYAPYFFFPEARYSAGIVRQPDGVRVTTMRNPWREFDCAHLGRLCEGLGGGGHQRFGAVALPVEQSPQAAALLQRLVAGIRAFHEPGVSSPAKL
jgi:hypothetical protein